MVRLLRALLRLLLFPRVHRASVSVTEWGMATEIPRGAPGWVAPPSEADSQAVIARRDKRRPGWGAAAATQLPPRERPRPPHR
jgi:hypothetical protein